jgi:hypothetical protein
MDGSAKRSTFGSVARLGLRGPVMDGRQAAPFDGAVC